MKIGVNWQISQDSPSKIDEKCESEKSSEKGKVSYKQGQINIDTVRAKLNQGPETLNITTEDSLL